MESESIIRDPFTVGDNNSLRFNAEIPQESFVNILTGDVKSLIKAAKDAKHERFASFSGREISSALVVDCISRVLFLQEHFEKELTVINDDEKNLVAVLSIGEIANSGKDYLEL